MRKIIVIAMVSLDNYSTGPGGDLRVLTTSEAFDAYNAERMTKASTLILGANTYNGFLGFWPAVADNPEATDDQRTISRRNGEMRKFVVSDSLTEADTAPWTDTTTIVARADAHERIAALKMAAGGDILIFGSRTLWHDLLAAGLVDEIHFIQGSVVTGGGTTAFDQPVTLRLLGAERFGDSDNLIIRYQV